MISTLLAVTITLSSLQIAVGATAVVVLLWIWAAFCLARHDWSGFGIIVATAYGVGLIVFIWFLFFAVEYFSLKHQT